MVFGIGIDAADIARVEKSIASPVFFRRVFGAEEQALLQSLSPKRRAESAAANFAGKEAFLKACGSGLGGFALCDIQILRLETGAPNLVLSGEALEFAKKNALTAHISLTHEAGLATAMVLLEQRR